MDKTLIKNTISIASIQGSSYILTLITLPYLVRTLAPTSYGELGFSLALIQYIVLLVDYGFNLSATQDIATAQGNKTKQSQIFWSVITCKIILACAGLGLLCILILLIPILQTMSSILFSGYLLVIGNILFPLWFFRGIEKMGWIAVSNISAKAISLPLIFLLIQKPDDAWLAAAIQGSTSVLAGIIGLYYIYKRQLIFIKIPTLINLKQQFHNGWHIFIASGSISLYTTSTTVILGIIAGPTAVGYFVAADKIRLAVQEGLLSPISQAIYPRINVMINRDPNATFTLIRNTLKIQAIGTALLSSAVFILAPWIVTKIYDSAYTPAISILQLLSPLPFIIGISNVLGMQTMLATGLKREFSQILIGSMLVNSCVIIPLTIYFQAHGAALAILITEIFSACTMAYLLYSKRSPIFLRR